MAKATRRRRGGQPSSSSTHSTLSHAKYGGRSRRHSKGRKHSSKMGGKSRRRARGGQMIGAPSVTPGPLAGAWDNVKSVGSGLWGSLQNVVGERKESSSSMMVQPGMQGMQGTGGRRRRRGGNVVPFEGKFGSDAGLAGGKRRKH